MAESQPSWVGRTLGGRYKIEELIGQGGMSAVYRAVDPNLRRAVAVKLIHPHLSVDPEFVRRFEQEAAAVAQLRHPNIVQVFDFDHDEHVYYIVLEHLPGETLQVQLESLHEAGQILPLEETIRIMVAVCDAVAYAHERGMIHRDLKPSNVMLGPNDQPILMDFGVAKMLDASVHTATGSVIGTAAYMAPEQARGEHTDERTDIYSLGVMLFEMAAGRRPFEGDSAITIMLKHVSEPVPDIRQIRTDTPHALASLIERALAKSPADRFQSAAEIAAELRASIKTTRPTEARQFTAPVAPASAPTGRSATVAAGLAQPPVRTSRRTRPLVLGGVAVVTVAAVAVLAILTRPGGPQFPPAEGMTHIDGGVYLVGLDAEDKDHAPQQQVKLEEFWIDEYEITRDQYAAFVAATGAPPPNSWNGATPPAGEEQHPVEGVTWNQAAAFCEWANKRLPTEAEWEVAARGREELLYPWGNDERAVELPRSGTYPVGQIQTNRSRFGAYDMAGNVWEWVSDAYAPIAEGHRVLRGGANGFLKDMAFRLHGDPDVPTMFATAGFRCAAPKVSGDVVLGPTPTAAPVVLAPGMLFFDNFTNPNSGWPVGEQDHYTFGYHPQAFYHVEVSAPNDRFIIGRDLKFADFSAETEVLVDHTDTDTGEFSYGLAFRRTGNEYYALLLSPRAQAWRVVKSAPSGVETLASGTLDAVRGLQKAPDRLRVDAAGPAFAFHINDQLVARLEDADYDGGEVGFIVETGDETLAHVHFASLAIREPETSSVLFADDFTDPLSGWPKIEDDSFFFGYHPPDFYHVEIDAPNTSTTVFRNLNYGDFTAEVDVQVDHIGIEGGDFRYGLAFRRNGDQYYAFVVSPLRGAWQVLKQTPEGLQVLAEGSVGSLQGLQRTNDQLRVDASGSDLAFHINGEPVARISGADLTSGEIGLYAETFDQPLAHVHYDSIVVREADLADLTAAPASTPTPVPTPPPPPEGMVLIPAGYFQMGSMTGQADELPEHPVLLDAFYLDMFEVTNAQYRECIADGTCTTSVKRNSFTHAGYRDDPAYNDYPVIGVTWDQAITYCSWAGKRLPTEAEWEYAASGPEDRTWPWGNTFDANLSAASAPDTQLVGSYPDGISPFGVFDMAGNVTEWVADVYSVDFFASSPPSNPLNTGGGDTRIFRGGSFANRRAEFYTTSRRFIHDRGYDDVDIGFRCAQDAPEVNAIEPANQGEGRVAEFCALYATYKPGAACP